MEWIKDNTETLITIAIILLVAVALTKFLRWLVTKSFTVANEKLSPDPTKYRFLKNAISVVVWTIAVALIISFVPKLKSLAVTLFAGAGILVMIIGFAAQQAFSNIIGGIFIVLFKPFRVGDLIKITDNEFGTVEDITLRHTVILNFENQRVIIPNSVISTENIINYTISDTIVCRVLKIGIAYDADIDKAIQIIQEVSEAHPLSIDFRTDEEKKNGQSVVVVRVTEFADFSVNLVARVWTSTPMEGARLQSDILKTILQRFKEEKIEIPYPYRNVILKKEV